MRCKPVLPIFHAVLRDQKFRFEDRLRSRFKSLASCHGRRSRMHFIALPLSPTRACSSSKPSPRYAGERGRLAESPRAASSQLACPCLGARGHRRPQLVPPANTPYYALSNAHRGCKRAGCARWRSTQLETLSQLAALHRRPQLCRPSGLDALDGDPPSWKHSTQSQGVQDQSKFPSSSF
jgi:hypothetical protein